MKSAQQKHIPTRTCIACRGQSAKQDMVRVVRDSEGEIYIDSKGKVRGRGANLCEKKECLEKALKGDILKNALKLAARISEEKKGELRGRFSEVLYEREFRRGNEKVVFRVNKED